MAVKIIDPLEDKRWLKFIASNSQANIFHHPSWLKVINGQYHYRVFAVCIFNFKNEITAGIPFCEVSGIAAGKKWISLPFSDYCQPLYCNAENLNELTEYIISESQKNKINLVEICWKLEEQKFIGESSYVYHITELPADEKILLNSFHRTKIQGIAKSLKQGLTAKFSTDIEALNTFYSLHLKTRKKIGIPIQPKGFFLKIYNEIIKNDLGFIVVISKDEAGAPGGKVELAAGLFMGFNDTLTYKYNASHPEYLQYRPNNLIIWTAMQQAIKKGYKFFDFGKSDFDNHGLRSFKDGWATTERSLNYSYYPALPSNGYSFKIIKDKLVSPIIKSSPDFVCKFIGEIAYKYFPVI